MGQEQNFWYEVLSQGQHIRLGPKFWLRNKIFDQGQNFGLVVKLQIGGKILGFDEILSQGKNFGWGSKFSVIVKILSIAKFEIW